MTRKLRFHVEFCRVKFEQRRERYEFMRSRGFLKEAVSIDSAARAIGLKKDGLGNYVTRGKDPLLALFFLDEEKNPERENLLA